MDVSRLGPEVMPDNTTEASTDPNAPSSISYIFDASTTQQISHSLCLSVGISPVVTLLADGNYTRAPNQPTIISGDAGFMVNVGASVTLRGLFTGTQVSGQPVAMGGTGGLDIVISDIWGATKHTRLSLSGGAAQSFEGVGVTDPFGLDSTIYQYSGTAGLTHEFAPEFQLGASYSYFGANDGQTARDSYSLNLFSQWTEQVSTNFSLTSTTQVNLDRSLAVGGSVTYMPMSQISVGIHANAFQQVIPNYISEADARTATDLDGMTIVKDPRRPFEFGYSGGVDLGFYW
jgi:hypothetical protein